MHAASCHACERGLSLASSDRILPPTVCADANYDAVPDAGWSKTLTMVLSLPKLKKGPGGHGKGAELM